MMRRNLLLVSLCAVISAALGIRVHPNDKGGGGTLQRAGLRQRSGARHRRLQAERADGARPGSRALSLHTTSTQFALGLIVNLLNTGGKLQLSPVTETFPFIWIPLSGRGTIVKVNTTDGAILGEYWSAPNGRGRNPSRTTVDINGNVWAGNRNEGSGGKGSVVHIGLEEFGQCVDRNRNGVIDTSTGLGDKRPWSNADGADTNGGVSNADDECIIHYVRTEGTHVRTVAVDSDDNLWAGGYSNEIHEKIDGTTGLPIPGTQFDFGCGGYGGLVDGNGVLWSAGLRSSLLRYDPATQVGTCLARGTSYGLAVDNDGNIWNTNWNSHTVTKLDPDGANLGVFTPGGRDKRGVAVTPIDNNVWIANSGTNDVSRLNNDGTLITTIRVGSTPTGVAVDNQGKVWVCNYNSHNAMRIDPATNAIDLTVGLGTGAYPYTYGDMTGAALLIAHPEGTWTVIEDSGEPLTEWGAITWNTEPEGSEPLGTSITVKARAHDIETSLNNVAYIEVSNGVTPPPSSLIGQFLQVKVTLSPNGDGNTPVLLDIKTSFANTPPVALCTNVTVEAVAPDCNADASIDGGSNDAEDADPEIVESPEGPYPLGPTLVTLTITDEAGVSAECQATVTVVDNLSPTLSVPDDVTLECGIDTYGDPGATATDICDTSPTVTAAGGEAVGAKEPGDYDVIYTATDASGNEASATRTVKVVDNLSPTLSVLDDVTLECGIDTFDDPGAAVKDICDTSPTVTAAGGEAVNVKEPGGYDVIYTATDASGNEASATRTVKVVDNLSPTFLSVPDDVTLECGIDTYADPGATATDICDTSPTVTAAGGEAVNVKEPGDYNVIYKATDASENEASATRTVKVVDNLSPTLSVPDDVTLECGIDTYADPGATATDICDTSPTVTTTGGEAVDVKEPGDYDVIYKATDASENEASATRTVKVVDTLAPTRVCAVADPIKVGEIFHAVTSHSDSCDSSPTVLNSCDNYDVLGNEFKFTAAGVYDCTAAVVDHSGNSALCPVVISVFDPTAGFVTGGGQIDSPAGAFKLNLESSGKASFGFNSKYRGKGATTPKGQTNFNFMGKGLHFTSTAVDILVVTGGNYARFKGHGTIGHEEGIYSFHVWAGDGTGPSGEDTFRIRIWSEEGGIDIYDNGMDQPIDRGQIKLHVQKKRVLRGGEIWF